MAGLPDERYTGRMSEENSAAGDASEPASAKPLDAPKDAAPEAAPPATPDQKKKKQDLGFQRVLCLLAVLMWAMVLVEFAVLLPQYRQLYENQALERPGTVRAVFWFTDTIGMVITGVFGALTVGIALLSRRRLVAFLTVLMAMLAFGGSFLAVYLPVRDINDEMDRKFRPLSAEDLKKMEERDVQEKLRHPNGPEPSSAAPSK